MWPSTRTLRDLVREKKRSSVLSRWGLRWWVGSQFDMSERHAEILFEIAFVKTEWRIEIQLSNICVAMTAMKQKKTFQSLRLRQRRFISTSICCLCTIVGSKEVLKVSSVGRGWNFLFYFPEKLFRNYSCNCNKNICCKFFLLL